MNHRPALIAALLFGIWSAAPPAAAASCSGASDGSLVAEAGRQLNAVRGRAGLQPVAPARMLGAIAARHACDMAAAERLAHALPGGPSFAQRLRAAGGCARAGENIAVGQRNATEAVGDWMDSPPHRKNVLMAEADSYGIAVARGRGGRLFWALVVAGGC